MDPLAPMAYRLLACRGLEEASGYRPDESVLRGRVAALEHERITSHLGWLEQLGRQTGLAWLEHHATRLQRVCLQTDFSQISHLPSTLRAFKKRLMQTPLLRARLAGIGTVTADSNLRGPVARAAGLASDARSGDVTYQALSFRRMQRPDGDAFDRLRIRLDEILHSIELIQSAGVLKAPGPFAVGTASGEGQASIETPRGEARLHLVLDNGLVSHAHLDTPSNHHVSLLPGLLVQQELGDALTTVCSLDLSPWEFAT
ncbi:MAG TPA: hypothetical protein ENI75_04715 [Mizugakiibacter sp.]|nr:hypothetical protein [Mizugakiibacter sp.]